MGQEGEGETMNSAMPVSETSWEKIMRNNGVGEENLMKVVREEEGETTGEGEGKEHDRERACSPPEGPSPAPQPAPSALSPASSSPASEEWHS